MVSPSRDQACCATHDRESSRVPEKFGGLRGGRRSDYGGRIEVDDKENRGGPVSRIAGEREIDVHGAVSC